VESLPLPLADAAQIYLGRIPGAVRWASDEGGASTRASPWRTEMTV